MCGAPERLTAFITTIMDQKQHFLKPLNKRELHTT
jgi:hypothetical protein